MKVIKSELKIIVANPPSKKRVKELTKKVANDINFKYSTNGKGE